MSPTVNRLPSAAPSRKNLSASAKMLFSAAAAAVLLVTSVTAPQVAHADKWWTMEVNAKAQEQAGNPAGAVPYWKELIPHFAGLGEWTNAALYAKSLAKYYDSVKQYDEAIRYYELENEYWLKDGKDWGAADTMRAEQIRTTLDLYVSTTDEAEISSMTRSSKGGLAKFEPESGVYIGMYSETDPQMGNNFTRSESIYGKKHALYLAYTPFDVKAPFPMQYARNAKAAGAALQFGFEPTGGLDAVQDGPYLRQWARDAKSTGLPIFLRFASEMNGNWTNWSGDPAKYIEKFRLVAKVMKEEAPNVAMVWSPGDVPKYSMAAYYPGDEYVDWVGVSLYTEPYGNGEKSDPMLGTSPIERLDELYRLYADRKPIMLSETAVAHKTHKNEESFTEWTKMNLDRLYSIMPKRYPRLKAITYFNSDLKSRDSQNDYLLRDNPTVMDLYKKLIADPSFLTKVEQGAEPAAPVGYVKAETSASFSKEARIVPFAKIPDIYIGRIDYTLNGRLVASQAAPPYGISLPASEVPEGSVFQVQVFNQVGKQAAVKSITLSSRVSIQLDGKDCMFEQPPVIRNGSTLAPMRAVFEAMGATVQWDQVSLTASGRKGTTTISLPIGQLNARRNGEVVPLEVPAQLINNFTMAPVRFIGEAFGGKVEWDNRTRTVKISTR